MLKVEIHFRFECLRYYALRLLLEFQGTGKIHHIFLLTLYFTNFIWANICGAKRIATSKWNEQWANTIVDYDQTWENIIKEFFAQNFERLTLLNILI